MTKKNSSRVKVLAFAVISLLVPPASGKDQQFSAIVNRLQTHYNKRPVRFIGFLTSVAIKFYRQPGVKSMKLAVFEDLDPSLHPPEADLDSFMQEVAGREFQLFVRVRSRRDSEQSFIYAREAGKYFEFLILDLEADEACVIKMKLDPEAMSHWLDEPVEMGKSRVHEPVQAASR